MAHLPVPVRVPFGARSCVAIRNSMEDKSVEPGIAELASQLVWYALLTPPGREFVAQRILRRYGLHTYVPLKREWRRKNKFVREKVLREYPIAPKYIFAGFGRGVPLWFDLFSLPDVRGVVGFNDMPAEIPGKAMARLIRKTGGGLTAPSAQRYMPTHREFTVGQEVEVIGGPFEGRKVPVVELGGIETGVEMELFNVMRVVKVPTEFLQAA